MSLTLDLPTPLADELTREAKQKNVSPAEHATRLVGLAMALLKDGTDTPFRAEVKSFLIAHSVDAEHVAAVLGELLDSPVIQTAGRQARRPSAMGKYAHLGVTSEDVAREKQEDIAREEKGWE